LHIVAALLFAIVPTVSNLLKIGTCDVDVMTKLMAA
jgi:hypothetical protein